MFKDNEDDLKQNYKKRESFDGVVGMYEWILTQHWTFCILALVLAFGGFAFVLGVLVIVYVRNPYKRNIVSSTRSFNEPVVSNFYFKIAGKDNRYWRYYVDASLLQRRNQSGYVVDHDVLISEARNLIEHPKNDYDVTPGYLVWSEVKSFTKEKKKEKPNFEVKREPFMAPHGATSSLESPSIVFVPQLASYFLFYTAVQTHNSHRARRPAVRRLNEKDWRAGRYTSEHWTPEKIIFSDLRSNDHFTDATLLFGETRNTTFLFYSDGTNILYTQPKAGQEELLLEWEDPNPKNILMKPRDAAYHQGFDSLSLRPGASPVALPSGDWLFIYNSFQNIPNYDSKNPRPNWSKNGNVGYAILDKEDPLKIKERGDLALFSPELNWERCDFSALNDRKSGSLIGYQPSTIAVSAVKPIANDRFLVYYTACGSHIGMAEVKIHSSR